MRGIHSHTCPRVTGAIHTTMFRSSSLKLAAALALSALSGLCVFSATTVETYTDLSLSANSFWNGSDGSGGFTSGSAFYNNSYNSTYGSWSGFAYSNRTNTAALGLNATYVAATGGGMTALGATEVGATYVVGYYSEYDDKTLGANTCIIDVDLAANERIDSIYVTNIQYTVNDILNGSSFSRAFTDGDYLRLIITGYTADGASTGAVDVYLVDFTTAFHEIMEDWMEVDLSLLGDDTTTLGFSMISSDTSYGYMNTPSYFAIGGLEISTIPEPALAGVCFAAFAIVFCVRRRRIA